MKKLITSLCAVLFVGTASFAEEAKEEKLPEEGRICYTHVFEYVLTNQDVVSGQNIETVIVWTVETCTYY